MRTRRRRLSLSIRSDSSEDMTADTVTTIGGTLVQHGRLSDRIYMMHLAPGDLPFPDILDDLNRGLLEDLCKSACFRAPLLYLAGVKGAEREYPTLQGGDESRAALRHTLA